MIPPNSAVSLSVALMATSPGDAASQSVERALARGDLVDVTTAVGAFGSLAPALFEAARRSRGDFVLALTPDAAMPENGWSAIRSAAAAPGVGAVRLATAGPGGDPAWRGRRVRAHERNIETVRFANLIAPGALAVRRQLLLDCLEGLDAGYGSDWWRELVRRVVRLARVERAVIMIARPRRLAEEPPSPGFAAPSPQRRPRVVVLGQVEVSTSLYFDRLEAADAPPVAFRALSGLSVDAPHLAAADLVVLVRELHRFWDEGVIELLVSAGRPFVYFTDDNFMALAREGGAPAFYRPDRMQRALAGAAEVWCSTASLAEAYGALHPRVRVWSPALDPALSPCRAGPTPGPLTIGIAGGDFRLAGLDGAPSERLRALAAARPVRLLVSGPAARRLASVAPEAELVIAPRDRSFRQFVRAWRARGVDILLHPAGATANAPFKCPTAAMVAHYLDAVPVVADEPAYAGWRLDDGVVRLGADGEGLAVAGACAKDADWRGQMSERLAAAVAARFDGAAQGAILEAALASGPRAQGARVIEVMASRRFRRRRAELSFVHAARWVSALGR